MSSKYQREIEEILENSGEFQSPGTRSDGTGYSLPQLVWFYVKHSLSGRLWSLNPGRVMLIGLVLLMTGLIVRPYVDGALDYLAWAGLLLSIVGYGMVLAKPPTQEKLWRGRLIEDPKKSWWARHWRRRQ
ncbi:hypothetical protein M1N23_02200 [Dehalococcoidia bacterium]|nr:hypothetical protein [Dehalococcoidia bacterium]